MSNYFIRLLVIIFFFQIYNIANSQKLSPKDKLNSVSTYRIVLEDESSFMGKMIMQTSDAITFKTDAFDKLEVSVKKVKSIELIDEKNIVKGVYWFKNPNDTRYLFGPSAINLKKGEGYYQNTYLVINSFNYGITDYFTIGGGFEIISTVTGTPAFMITPKVGFKVSENFHAGGGLLYANVLTNDSPISGLGIAYGIGTYGSSNHNVTLGVGFGYVDKEISNRPILTISGMTRIARKTALVTENWLVPGAADLVTGRYYGVYSYGVRFFGEKIAVDLAFLNNPELFEIFRIGIPYVDFVIKF